MNMKIDLISNMISSTQKGKDIKKTLDSESFLSILDFQTENENSNSSMELQQIVDNENNSSIDSEKDDNEFKKCRSLDSEDDEVIKEELPNIIEPQIIITDYKSNIVLDEVKQNELSNDNNTIDNLFKEDIINESLLKDEEAFIKDNVNNIVDKNITSVEKNNIIENEILNNIINELKVKKSSHINILNNDENIVLNFEDTEGIIDVKMQKVNSFIELERLKNIHELDKLNITDIKEAISEKLNVIKDVSYESEISEASNITYINDDIQSNENVIQKEEYIEFDNIQLRINKDDVVSFSNKDILEDSIENQINILSNLTFNTNSTEVVNYIEVVQPEIRQEFITEDIVQTVEYINSNNIEELTVKINPKELGEITISLISQSNFKKCVIKVQEESTLELIKLNIDEIKNHLNTLDIPIEKIEVDVKTNNENDFLGNFKEQFEDRNRKNNKKEKSIKVINENNTESLIEKDNNIDLVI